MTSNDETTRFVRNWLEEGDTRLPDRVLDEVLDLVAVTPQRRRWSWMLPFSNLLAPVGIATAAIVVAALVGLNLLMDRQIGGPEPTPQPTPAGDVTSDLVFWTGRELPPGEYFIDDPFPLRVSMAVPAGWEAFGVTDGLAAICNNDCELPDRTGMALWAVTNVYEEPCDAAGLADPPIGPTVDDLVDALSALTRHDAEVSPEPVEIGGYSARYVELTADAELGDCALRGFRAWTAGSDFRESPPGDRDRLWIVDVEGVRLMVDIAYPADASADDLAELQEVVESLRFERRVR